MVMKRTFVLCAALILLLAGPAFATREKDQDDKGPLQAATFAGLKFRSLGPALTSGRVGDFAVDPAQPWEYFVAVSSGGVWRTINNGTTFEPVFDGEGSYSIGCVALAPGNPLIVWVGTGENNSQRSVSYGDGVYKSTDGGKHWQNMGLQQSEHIGQILIHPHDPDIVYVAAQGPLWRPGGDRGLYKTTDGGKTWDLVLEISEDTGVNEVVMDPRDPDVLYATAYQRRRHTWVLIDGGPESAIYKSTDGGASWDKLSRGLPDVDLGRIGLAIPPTAPNTVYAIIEAARDESGFYRSRDGGANWEKMSDYLSSSPQYYQEIIADPVNPDRVYSLDTFLQVTEDGGRTFSRVKIDHKHVDDHAMWIDPGNTDHLLVGCDGGVYETFDRGQTWDFKANLPVTQFYKITVDNDFPFYSVYGGTQDNNTLGTKTRSTSDHGIVNSDWFITLGGDGFEPQVDPVNPDLIYSQYQYGGLARFDRRSGERIDIRPQPAADEDPHRWNWNSPLLISPHSPARLYYACQRIFRSDDRGDSWLPISDDLTRRLDRNRLPVMGRVWGVDTVAKNRSTSFFGNVVSLAESRLQEGLIFAGTDDGLIQVTEDGGATWTRREKFGDVPEMSYVSCLTPSWHDPDCVFAAFDNHKQGDFQPYLLESTDRGRSWRSIAGDLPERGHVHSVVQDHVNPDLLFVGTEFGVFFTLDRGRKWVQLGAGIPTIACRDLDIQRRENDLAVGTFGRGIYILDDYTPLRHLSAERLAEEAILFPVKKTWLFMERFPLGGRGKGNQGHSYFNAPNPPHGAVFSYYLAEGLQTLAEKRHEAEKERQEKGEDVFYPDWEELRREDREEEPAVILTVTNADGNVVRRLSGPTGKGLHRVTWNLRYPSPRPASLTPWQRTAPWQSEPAGPMVAPGPYTVSLAKRMHGVTTPLGEPRTFETVPLGMATLPATDLEAVLAFQLQTARLQRAVMGAVRAAGEAQNRIDHIERALLNAPDAAPSLTDRALALDERLKDLRIGLQGDPTISSRSEPTPPSVTSRVSRIIWGGWNSTSAPTGTQRESYAVAAAAFAEVLAELRQLVEVDLTALEADLEAAGGPWTPGRIPSWEDR